ncbi:hypothetical protein FQR65_LT16585 [Abscondita terminalis]|nr:hypothetical protein FQR65_LT16585 [Abscondita terminalis]
MEKNFRYAIDPLIKILCLIGYFDLLPDKKWFSRWNFAVKLCLMILCVIHLLAYFLNIAENVIDVTTEFFHFHNYLIIISSIIISILCKKRVMKQLTTIVAIDTMLKSFGNEQFDYLKSRKQLTKYLAIWSIFRLINISFGEIAAYFDGIDFTRYRIYIITSFFNASTNFLMLFILAELRLRLGKVHKVSTKLFLARSDPKVVLKFMKQMYSVIWTVANEINKIFELSLLLEISTNAVFTVFACFWANLGTIGGETSSYYRYAGYPIWISYLVIHVMVIVHYCSSFSDERIVGTSVMFAITVHVYLKPYTVYNAKYYYMGWDEGGFFWSRMQSTSLTQNSSKIGFTKLR